MSVIRREIRRKMHRRKHTSEAARQEAKKAAARKYYRAHREEILHKARLRRASMGPRGRGREYGPMFIGPLRPQNTRRTRKKRSNAGVKRGPRHFPRNTGLFN